VTSRQQNLISKEQKLESWAKENNIELTPELYLLNQRSEILSQMEMIGIQIDIPGVFLESLNSAQFAEVLAGLVKRNIK